LGNGGIRAPFLGGTRVFPPTQHPGWSNNNWHAKKEKNNPASYLIVIRDKMGGHEDHSQPSTDFKNAWSYTSTPHPFSWFGA
jgi:hypothetical protein